MGEKVLTLRELNRATLARQILLKRETIPIPAAIEQVAGLQAQVTNPPYIGLWARLQDFERPQLMAAMEARQIVRSTFMRSTIHLVTADDYLRFRTPLQPALTRALNAFFGRSARGLDIEKLVAAAKAQFEAKSSTFVELRTLLSQLEPEREPEALAYAVRTHLPFVRLPPGGFWGSGGSPAHTTPEVWLGQPVSPSNDPRPLILRYLAAFGPANVMDFQTWAGLTKIKEDFEKLKPELRSFRDESGKELFDLPNMPLPSADTPAPPRFLPEYDNLLLSHANRNRVIADKYRPKVFLSAARVRATFLLDGFVRGTWKIERNGKTATLVVEPFEALSTQEQASLIIEAESLVRFVEDKAEAFTVRFVDAA